MRRRAFIIFTLFFIFTAAYAQGAYAQTPCPVDRDGVCVSLAPAESRNDSTDVRTSLAQAFPGLEFLQGITINSTIDQILTAVYRFGISIVALAAFGMLVFGGVVYATAGDSSSRVGYARSLISNALFGLLLALLSFLLLYIINPDLVFNLKLDRLGAAATPTDIDRVRDKLSLALQQELGMSKADADRTSAAMIQQFASMTPEQMDTTMVNMGLSPQTSASITADYTQATLPPEERSRLPGSSPSPPPPPPPPPFPETPPPGSAPTSSPSPTPSPTLPPPDSPPPFTG